MSDIKTQIKKLQLGDHACLIYRTRHEQLAAVIPFLKEGLRRGEACVYVLHELTGIEIARALEAAGVDVVAETERGALSFLNARQAYLRSGRFSPTGMEAKLQQLVKSKLAAGFKGLRASGEMSWALENGPGAHLLFDYEATLTDICSAQRPLCLCQYNRRRFPAASMRDIRRTHTVFVEDQRHRRN
jgi:hypothetical protein